MPEIAGVVTIGVIADAKLLPAAEIANNFFIITVDVLTDKVVCVADLLTFYVVVLFLVFVLVGPPVFPAVVGTVGVKEVPLRSGRVPFLFSLVATLRHVVVVVVETHEVTAIVSQVTLVIVVVQIAIGQVDAKWSAIERKVVPVTSPLANGVFFVSNKSPVAGQRAVVVVAFFPATVFCPHVGHVVLLPIGFPSIGSINIIPIFVLPVVTAVPVQAVIKVALIPGVALPAVAFSVKATGGVHHQIPLNPNRFTV